MPNAELPEVHLDKNFLDFIQQICNGSEHKETQLSDR